MFPLGAVPRLRAGSREDSRLHAPTWLLSAHLSQAAVAPLGPSAPALSLSQRMGVYHAAPHSHTAAAVLPAGKVLA